MIIILSRSSKSVNTDLFFFKKKKKVHYKQRWVLDLHICVISRIPGVKKHSFNFICEVNDAFTMTAKKYDKSII